MKNMVVISRAKPIKRQKEKSKENLTKSQFLFENKHKAASEEKATTNTLDKYSQQPNRLNMFVPWRQNLENNKKWLNEKPTEEGEVRKSRLTPD